ncbi:hypothetical protein RRG08_009936 [Elysia crispata]|uniref:Uncharacterized protein n=1 Tax=Elysia crispata TaxID=231223 RepID=A0AAE1ARG4_9GAST|nr:hypothetical protein RRG08_009936 [Elysia crispata]
MDDMRRSYQCAAALDLYIRGVQGRASTDDTTSAGGQGSRVDNLFCTEVPVTLVVLHSGILAWRQTTTLNGLAQLIEFYRPGIVSDWFYRF